MHTSLDLGCTTTDLYLIAIRFRFPWFRFGFSHLPCQNGSSVPCNARLDKMILRLSGIASLGRTRKVGLHPPPICNRSVTALLGVLFSGAWFLAFLPARSAFSVLSGSLSLSLYMARLSGRTAI